MKKVVFILTFIFMLGMTFSAHAIKVKIRPYGALGITTTDYDELDGSKFSWGVGGQGLFGLSSKFSLGIDLAYLHAFTWEDDVWNWRSRWSFLNVLCVGEFNLAKIVVLQAGLGPYFPVGDNDDTEFGFMFAGGVDIPVGSDISIPVMVRFDIILDREVIVPIRFMSGVTIKL